MSNGGAYHDPWTPRKRLECKKPRFARSLRGLTYGVLPEHYDVVGEALIATLGDALGTDFTSDVKDAWVAVWGIVRNTMVSDHYDEKSGCRMSHRGGFIYQLL